MMPNDTDDENLRNRKPVKPLEGQDTLDDIDDVLDNAFSDKSCLKEFCAETSLAGFKYLLPEYGPTIRRLIWAFVCLLFTGITLYQLGFQLWGYMKTPLAVAIGKQYPPSLVFPVVVICNSMPYRVSRVKPQSSMHRALSELYASPVLNRTKARKYKWLLSRIDDTEEYLRHVAFNKSDMIVRCVWKRNETCTPDDFKTIIVDSRICYAFNSGINGTEVRSVDRAGEENGLELTLNVETYERMQGPYSTFGIVVSFHQQDRTPSLRGAISTLIGASTKIGLRQKEIKYYRGLTCDSRELKYFPSYSREACALEQQINSVQNICRCYPYMVEEELIDEGNRTCNLYEHFHCAETEIANAINVTEGVCPQECHVVLYDASVSQSIIAWDRAQTQLKTKYKELRHLKRSVLRATEIRHRFDPKNNETTTALLDRLFDTINRSNELQQQINNMTWDANLPYPGSLPPVIEQFDQFEAKFLLSEEMGIPFMRKQLEALNESLYVAEYIFSNSSFVDAILKDRKKAKGATLEELSLPLDYFILSENTLYLNTLQPWLETLKNIKEHQNEMTAASSTLMPAWQKVMSENETSAFNDLLESFFRIGLLPGCLDEAYDGEIITDNSTDVKYLTDIVTCFNHHFTSSNVKQLQAVSMTKTVSFISEKEAEHDHQTKQCDKLLCELVEAKKTHECTLNAGRLHTIIIRSVERLIPRLESCWVALGSTLMQLEGFLEFYRNTTLPAFVKTSDRVVDYRKTANEVSKRLSSPIWPYEENTEWLQRNVTSYRDAGYLYRDLSRNMTMIHKQWMENNYLFGSNQARTRLKELLLNYDELDGAKDEFNTKIETDPKNDLFEGRGPFGVLAGLLWKNKTVDGLQEVSDTVARLRNETNDLLAQLPAVTEAFRLSMELLIKDSQGYLDRLQMDDTFYDRNFMAVNVYFNEISKDIVTQKPSYEFWSLMADIGGASGLWLGFCMVTLVELVDTALRHCIFRIGRLVYKKGEQNISKVVPAAALSKIGLINDTADAEIESAEPAVQHPERSKEVSFAPSIGDGAMSQANNDPYNAQPSQLRNRSKDANNNPSSAGGGTAAELESLLDEHGSGKESESDDYLTS